MTSSNPDTTGSLRAARQIDDLCDRFEATWKTGKRARIEDLLLECAGAARLRLLEELLLLEISLRKRAGETPVAADYAGRFAELSPPALGEILRRGLGDVHAHGSTPGNDSTVAHEGGSRRIAPPRLRYFGDYELLDQIARGGMGVVYKARQISLNRLVAVKMILSGQFASEAQVKRFYSEAESAAQLDHPNIVSIYEVGEHDGDHYFSMALVEGTSLAAKLAEGPMEPRRAAELVSQVAQAIEYAHSKGVIHRDLKPSNVLLDANGRPRVTDFGLAKRVSDAEGLTMSGDVLGTPSYMPPEQAAGKIDAVGPASDVYALGAVLYALLSGRPPFQAASSHATLTQVVEQEPVRLRQLNVAIPRDLETITQKCLEKSVARRYSSAAALAKDLDNYLAGRPILARPTTRIERVWRWCRRNPVVASLIGLAAALLVAITSVANVAYFREVTFRETIQKQSGSLTVALRDTRIAFGKEQVARKEETAAKQREAAAREKAVDSAKQLARTLYISDVNRLEEYARDGNIERIDALLRRHLPAPGEADLRGWEWYYWWQYAHGEKQLLKLDQPVQQVAISGDGRYLAIGVEGGKALVCDGKTLERMPFTLAINDQHWSALAFANDNVRLLGSGRRGGYKSWNMREQSVEQEYSGGSLTAARNGIASRFPAAFAPDGKSMLINAPESYGVCWKSLRSDAFQTLLELSDGLYSQSFLPTIATAPHINSRDLSISSSYLKYYRVPNADLWERDVTAIMDSSRGLPSYYSAQDAPGAPPPEEWGVAAFAACFSPDGRYLAGGNRDGKLFVYRAGTQRLERSINAHRGIVWCAAFNAQGNCLASGGKDGEVHLWEVSTGKKLADCLGHRGPVRSLTFLGGTNELASAGDDGQIILWAAPTGERIRTLRGHTDRINSLSATTDGSLLVSGSASGEVRVWNSQPIPDRFIPSARIGTREMVVSADEKTLLCDASTMAIYAYDLANHRAYGALDKSGQEMFNKIAVGGDPPMAAALTMTNGVVVWDVRTLKQVKRLTPSNGVLDTKSDIKGMPRHIALSPDGKLLAVAAVHLLAPNLHLHVQLFQTDTWKNAGTFDLSISEISVLEFSPDGRRLLVAGRNIDKTPSSVSVWDVQSKTQLASYTAGKDRPEMPGAAVWSPDGKQIAITWNPLQVGVTRFALHDSQTLEAAIVTELDRNLASGGKVLGFDKLNRPVVLYKGLQIWNTSTGEFEDPPEKITGTHPAWLRGREELVYFHFETYRFVSCRPFEGSATRPLVFPLGAVRGVKLDDGGNRLAVECWGDRQFQPWQWAFMLAADRALDPTISTGPAHPLPFDELIWDKSLQGPLHDPFLLFSPRGRAGAMQLTFTVNTSKPEFARPLQGRDPWRGVVWLASTSDHRSVATVIGGGTIIIWNDAGGGNPYRYEPASAFASSARVVEFSPTGAELALMQGRRVQVADRTGKVLRECPVATAPLLTIAWSPDGSSIVAAAEDGSVHLYDAESGEETRLLRGHKGAVHSVAFALDDKTLLSGGDDGLINCYDLTSGEVKCRLAAHAGPVRDLAISGNGRMVVSGGDDGAARFWRTSDRQSVEKSLLEVRLGIPADETPLERQPRPDSELEAEHELAVKLCNLGFWVQLRRDDSKPVLLPADTEIVSDDIPQPPSNVVALKEAEAMEVDPETGRPRTLPRKWDSSLMPAICKLPRLGLANLHGVELNDADWKCFRASSSLVSLNVSQTKVTKPSLDVLANCKDLRFLDVSGLPMDDQSAEGLSKFTQLRKFNAANTRLSDASASKLARLTELEVLDLSGTSLTSAGVAQLSRLPSLQVLDLSHTQIDDRALDALARFPALKSARLLDTSLSLEAAIKLAKTRTDIHFQWPDVIGVGKWAERAALQFNLLPRTVLTYPPPNEFELILDSKQPERVIVGSSITFADSGSSFDLPPLTENDVQTLENLPTVVLLSIDPQRASDEQFERIIRGLKLEELTLLGRPSNRMIECIADSQLGSLTLSLRTGGNEPPTLAPLSKLTTLKSLNLSTKDWPLPRIAEEMPQLERLSVQKRSVTAQDIESLGRLENLRELTLYYVTLDAPALEQLGKLSALERLSLTGAEFSPEELSNLRSALPKCKITGTGAAFKAPRKK